MFARITRSIEIAKMTLRVMKQDPELLLFPFFGAIFSVMFMGVLLVPSLLIDLGNATQGGAVFGILEYVLLFISYFGLAFIATFFNTCTVYTTKRRFEGGNATLMESLKFALSRLPQIAAWSAVAASVGIVLARLDAFASHAGGIAGMVARGLRSLIGISWSVATLFVVPVMVYEGVGPFDAIKRSAETLQQTWGESLVRHFGFFFVGFLLFLPGIALIFLAAPASTIANGLAALIVCIAVLYFVTVVMVLNVASTIFNTALYHFSQRGEAGLFDPTVLRRAIGQR